MDIEARFARAEQLVGRAVPEEDDQEGLEQYFLGLAIAGADMRVIAEQLGDRELAGEADDLTAQAVDGLRGTRQGRARP